MSIGVWLAMGCFGLVLALYAASLGCYLSFGPSDGPSYSRLLSRLVYAPMFAGLLITAYHLSGVQVIAAK